jgi:hypothetical protein
MTGAYWWAKVKHAREQRASAHVTSEPAWQLTKAGHTAGLELRHVGTIGTEIVLLVDGELVKSRLYRSHEQAELAAAIVSTRERFQLNGWH